MKGQTGDLSLQLKREEKEADRTFFHQNPDKARKLVFQMCNTILEGDTAAIVLAGVEICTNVV
jgi:hypothetical protein